LPSGERWIFLLSFQERTEVRLLINLPHPNPLLERRGKNASTPSRKRAKRGIKISRIAGEKLKNTESTAILMLEGREMDFLC